MQKRKNGWQVRWRENGKQRARTFRLKMEAQAFEVKLFRGTADTYRAPSMTFGELAEKYLTDYARIEKAERSTHEDGIILRNHLLPAFNAKRIASLTKADLITFRGQLVTERKLAPKTVNNICGLAKRIIAVAVEWEILQASPWQAVKPLKIQQQPFAFWMPEESAKFLAFCQKADPVLWEVCLVALHTGMRRGEIQGLKRDCLDFDNRLITVRRSWNDKLKVLSEVTKSKQVRRIRMTPEVFSVLQARMVRPADSLVFPEAATLGTKQVKRIAKRGGVTPIRFHDLRHTFASQLAMAGTALAVIQALLGHSTMAMTERYAHLHPDTLAGAVDVLSAQNVRAQGGLG